MNEPLEGIRALLGRYGLPAATEKPLAQLLDLLTSDPTAPSAVRDPAGVLDDHLADALVALELHVVRAAASVADIGSGAGVPGLPLAIAMPRTSFTLVESNGRKCAFIERAVLAMRVRNVKVVQARAEQWHEGIGRCELVTARALAALPVVLEYAAPLLVQRGAVVAWRGARDPAAEAQAETAAGDLGLTLIEVRRVEPYRGTRGRHLHVYMKQKPTPAGFPRRPGIARKRPLTGRSRSI